MAGYVPAVVAAVVSDRGDGKRYALAVAVRPTPTGEFADVVLANIGWWRRTILEFEMHGADIVTDGRCISTYVESGDRLSYAHLET